MKNLNFYTLGLVIAGILFSTGCKKDSEEEEGGGNNPPFTTDYRMIEMIGWEDGIEDSKAELTYDGEQLSQVLEYTTFTKDQWNLDAKADITYPSAHSFEMVYSDYESGNWELDYKDVVTLDSGLWQTYMEYFYDGVDWLTAYQTDYTYNSGKIVKEETFEYMNGQMENDQKLIYSWAGDLPSFVENYNWNLDSWEAQSKDTMTYENGKIHFVETYSYDLNDYILRLEFQYVGDAIKSIIFYYNLLGTWTNGGSVLYSYDENGNLIEEEYTGQWTSKSAYAYEEGKGNIDMFIENTGWFQMPGLGKSAEKSRNSFSEIRKIKNMLLKK